MLDDEARHLELTAEATQRRAMLSKLALQPTQATAGLEFTTASKFVPKPTKPASVDLLAKERSRRLLELTKEAFPDGKVPDPFTFIFSNVNQAVTSTLNFPDGMIIYPQSACSSQSSPVSGAARVDQFSALATFPQAYGQIE